MSGVVSLKPILIGLAVLSTAYGKCPFTGAADEAAIRIARDVGGHSTGSQFIDEGSYVLYTTGFQGANEDQGLRQLIREKRSYEIPQEALRSAVSEGQRMTMICERKLASEKKVAGSSYVSNNDSSYGHYVNFRVHEPSINLHSVAISLIRATKKLQQDYAHRFGMTPATFTEFLRHHGFTVSEVSGSCTPDPVCRKFMPYRTIDGSCNNPKRPSWGMSRTALIRIARPTYSDAIFAETKSVTGHPLPLAALVRMILFPDLHRPDPVWTRSTPSWGQFMAHDMSLAPSTQSKDGPIQCCKRDHSGKLPPNKLHPACLPIEVPENHPFYSKFGIRCLNFVRTMTVPTDGCRLGPGQQLNAVTAFLDLSLVYGSNDQTARSLRTFHGGLLKASFVKETDGEVLPDADDKQSSCAATSQSEPCYKAGDVRVNLHMDLTIMHILFMRWHNIIAREMQKLNPHWNDEKLYQEARKYCIAAYQHVCYTEWLPIFLGHDFMVKHGILRLDVDRHGYVRDYNPDIPPAIINSFTTGAFRFLHTTTPGTIELLTPDRKVYNEKQASDFFNKPGPIEDGHSFQGLLRGAITQPMESTDQYFTHELTGLLFKGKSPHGLDLISIDIQRHRDHGLASYNTYRHICGLPKAKKWSDYEDVFHPEKIERLQKVYRHVDDVDLEVGCALETHVKGSLLGPTSLCIIAEQFYRSRVGDRFFYMNGNEGSFDPAKLAEIKKYTWAKIICETSGGVHDVQAEAFRQLGGMNLPIDCRRLPEVNIRLWKE